MEVQANALSLLSSNMAKIYLQFCKIVSSNDIRRKIKTQLASLLAYADSWGLTGHAALAGLRELKTKLNSDVLDDRAFSVFYRFVHFICRQKGQKGVSVDTAVEAWKLVLAGRLSLLNEWCTFVKEDQQCLTISEDEWLQLLRFSQVVQEDLSNFDFNDAWPVLMDEFVEYMDREASLKDNDISLRSITDDFGVISISSKSNVFPGVNVSAGFERKPFAPLDITQTLDCVSMRVASLPKQPSLPYSSVDSEITEEVAMETD